MIEIHALAALEAGRPLEAFTYTLGGLASQDCLIRVCACGVCHSDLHMIDNDWGRSRYPLVPGHEVVGEVVEVGSEVRHLKPGDRVGVGWQRSACLQCLECLRGNENLCAHSQATIVTGYGGFGDYLAIDARFAFKIPAGIPTHVAGPLLCGGITVYSGLRAAGMSSGQEIGVIGVGGLGHLAVQFAGRLGNRVTVFTTSEDKARQAAALGAHRAVIVPPGESPPPPVERLDIIISTIPYALDAVGYLAHLAADGTLVFVGVPPEPLALPVRELVRGRRRLMGSGIGSRSRIVEMLSVAERFGVMPIVETFAMAEANEALERVRRNRVRYRAVLLAE
ncbi:NAD(P)-dependent alcohol dehydrogenase [Gloeobacter morelensis]|uniref:NAD(P)-dependent alcohol dehydrogenase n=1 Tax=Gloeobacter morelensis TaxID=2907343 RepID=UPI001E34537E|nr:NAD(P)-dependent alcohol dehydrogenase [Gloeobacter morelensis]